MSCDQFDKDAISVATLSAFQSRVTSRVSKSLLACRSFGQFTVVITSAMEDLGCSGFGKFMFARDVSHIKFGNGLREGVSSDQHIIMNSERVALIVDATQVIKAEVSMLRETVAILFEVMTIWLQSYSDARDYRLEVMQEQINVVEHLDSSTQCLHRINDQLIEGQNNIREQLLSQLMEAFPTLDLSTYQQNVILNIINRATEREREALSLQIQQNSELRALVERVIEVLKSSDAPEDGLVQDYTE